MDEEEWALWTAAREEIARRLEPAPPMRGGSNGPCTAGLHFVSASFATSPPAFHVGLAWTNSGLVDIFAYGPLHAAETNVATFTNDENVVVTWTNVEWHAVEPGLAGLDNDWEWVGALTVTNAATNVFVDTGFPPERAKVRFYAAAEAVDTDGDGLNDGFEMFVSHSDPDIADTDGDGVGDGAEVAMGSDPADPAVSPRVTLNAVLYTPADTNNLEKQWVELYSAAAATMDLSGFRLEVGQPGGWSNAVAFGAGTIMEPGRCLLVGGSQVTNADITANALAIPNPGRSDWPTGVRLVWGGATNGNVVDTVMLGGHTNFNLDVAGWMSPTSIWTYAGRTAVRRYPGLDTDRAEDWTWATNRPGQNSGVEIDTDNDGLSDGVEWTGGANTNAMCFGEPTNPWNADSDGDGLSDSEECLVYGTNPNTWATDGDIYPWMPGITVVSNWPGSDSFEVASGKWDPTVADQNTNGIPDSWEMAFDVLGLDFEGDADGDGVANLSEVRQNSNPLDASDFEAKRYAVMMESSRPGWVNGASNNDVGLGGWVRLHFYGSGDAGVVVWAEEGYISEPFTLRWDGAVNGDTEIPAGEDYGLAWGLLTGEASLTIQDSALRPNFINTEGGEYTVGWGVVDVALADPEDAGWADLEEKQVVLSDQDLRVKITIRPAQGDLATVFGLFGNTLRLVTSETAPEGRDLTLTAANTVAVQRGWATELRIAIGRAELKSLGLLPEDDEDDVDELVWLDQGEDNSDAPSNLTDGLAFEAGMQGELRGRCTPYGTLESTPPNSPIDKTFFQAAGRELVTATYALCESPRRQIMNQADWFYYSGHGYHQLAQLQGGFRSEDVTAYWNEDLEWVVFAGCAILDIGDYRARSFRWWTRRDWEEAGGNCSPGSFWEGSGPKYLLGYNWSAPLDNQGATAILENFLQRWNAGENVLEAWKNANNQGVGRNACAIDCNAEPHRYWYWQESMLGTTWTNQIKTGGHW